MRKNNNLYNVTEIMEKREEWTDKRIDAFLAHFAKQSSNLQGIVFDKTSSSTAQSFYKL